jgi:hypothetical protein
MMQRKIINTALAIFIMAFSANAQSIEKNLDKLAKDPKQQKNAAKADVYVLGHRIMNDSLQNNAQPAATKIKKKKAACKKHK